MEVVSGLNSVRLIQTTYRLEFDDDTSVDDKIGADVTHVLSLVKHGDDTFRLVRDLEGTQGHFECTVVHRLAVPRT